MIWKNNKLTVWLMSRVLISEASMRLPFEKCPVNTQQQHRIILINCIIKLLMVNFNNKSHATFEMFENFSNHRGIWIYDENLSGKLVTEQFEIKLWTECFAMCVTLFRIVVHDNCSSQCRKTSLNFTTNFVELLNWLKSSLGLLQLWELLIDNCPGVMI